ncbi:MAG: hypothetical protein ACTHK9_11535 [Nitrobacter sp.]|jgi:hypothetical protein
MFGAAPSARSNLTGESKKREDRVQLPIRFAGLKSHSALAELVCVATAGDASFHPDRDSPMHVDRGLFNAGESLPRIESRACFARKRYIIV